MAPKMYPLLLVMVLLLGCEGSSVGLPKSSKKTNPPKIVPVRIARATLGSISSFITATCTITVEEKVDLFTEIGGTVKEAKKLEGQGVTKNEVLVKLKDETLRLDLKKARADLEKQNDNFEIIKKEYAKNLISQRDYDEARHQLRLAKIARELAEATLEKTEIRAPFSGVITYREVTQGQQIFPNTKVYSLINLDTIIAEVFVPEGEVSRIQVDHKAKIFVEAQKKTYRGEVKRISPVVDNESGMVKVTLSILPPHKGLKVGSFARVTITTGQWNNIVLIPTKALIQREEKHKVFVVKKDLRIEEREVELGERDSIRVSILKGIKVGEEVVIEGHYNLQAGQKVEIFSPNRRQAKE